MADANPSGSPLDRITGAAGPDATAAFKLLSNETRLAILIALWEAFEPLAEDNAVPFSDLRERVGTGDSGQFNYHLDQLTDHFVRSGASGYELSAAGHKLVRAVLAGSGLGEPTVAPSELDLACNRCGASPVTVSYHDEAVHLTCGSCEGFMTTERFPEGLIGHFEFDPAGLSSRGAGEILAGSWIAENLRLRSLLAGICPECSGPIETNFLVCEDHVPGPGRVCDSCGRRDVARVRYVCEICKYWNEGPAQIATIGHPAVISFYDDHGIDLRVHVSDLDRFQRVWQLIWQMEHHLASTDPVEIRVTIPCGGDELRLRLDESLSVVAVDRPD